MSGCAHRSARHPSRRVAAARACSRSPNLFCGWSCVVYAMRGELETAAPFIGVAMVLDMLDGRIARMTGTTSEFGVQLDSLADVDLVRHGAGGAGVRVGAGAARPAGVGASGFLFVTAAALRLARFNIQKSTPTSATSSASPARPRRRSSPRRSSTTRTGCTTQAARPSSACRARARAGAADGEHHPLPQLQDDRHRRAAPLPDPHRRWPALLALIVTYPHEVLLVMAYGYLPRVRRPRAAQAAATRARRASEPQSADGRRDSTQTARRQPEPAHAPSA